MKRILFISHTARLEAGTSRALLKLLKYLKSDYTPVVAVDTLPGDLPIELEKMNIQCLRLPIRTFFFLPHIIITIIKNKIALVYGNGFNGRSMIALIASKVTGRPFICHVHESLSSNSRTWWLKYASLIIANSQDTANRILRFTNLKNVVVVPNGIELENFSILYSDARSFLQGDLGIDLTNDIVINVGSICPRKNQIHSIEIAARVLQSSPNTQFLFLGAWQDLKYLEKIRDKIHEFKIDKNIHLLGFKQNVEVYLQASNILLHTAEIEPQGQIVLEAMAARLPVVAYEVGGVGESIIQGETGFLRSFGDKDGLTSDLMKLLSNQNLGRMMGEAGFQYVKANFTADVTADLVSKLLTEFVP